jgi:hypothetical protein
VADPLRLTVAAGVLSVVTGNGEGHLAMHYEQLKALRAR